ncbi:hypothetical protein B296_00030305 [Ensete ventricosum]|uniref:Uncharacterized protein n=1 Tax=Ensete ventricosum TaxID=4639 RepID=A0A426XSN4_ENSVE|nr:hypothetical protein B296_00030305 [Ensete ventricosum]
MVAPFTGLKSTSAFPVTRKTNAALSHLPSNGGRVQCMEVGSGGGRNRQACYVWPIEGKKKFETLSYLPTLVDEALVKQIEYLLRSKWIPCLESSHVSTVKLNLPKEVGRRAFMGWGTDG